MSDSSAINCQIRFKALLLTKQTMFPYTFDHQGYALRVFVDVYIYYSESEYPLFSFFSRFFKNSLSSMTLKKHMLLSSFLQKKKHRSRKYHECLLFSSHWTDFNEIGNKRKKREITLM
jgi:hypothetical protein